MIISNATIMPPSTIRTLILNFIFLFICGLINPTFSYDLIDSGNLKVVYPRNGSKFESSNTFIVGQASKNAKLTCNGEIMRLSEAGFFAHVVPLHYGDNNFSVADSISGSNVNLTVQRGAPPAAISSNELKLSEVQPNQNMGVTAGDIINFTVRATPNANVKVQLGTHCINLITPHNQSSTSGVTYGKTFKKFDSNNADLYKGSCRVLADDHFNAVHPLLSLESKIGNLQLISKYSISTVESLQTARTIKNSTVVRLGPGLARTTPLCEGIKIIIDGWAGDNMRCLYAPNKHVWIAKKDLAIQPTASSLISDSNIGKNISDSSAPQSVAQTINIIEDAYGEKVCLPLSERLPYQIEQKLNPNSLILKVYGVTPDTDWITSEPKTGNESLSNLEHVNWHQSEDNVYEITASLKDSRQWGYRIYYEGNTLCLAIKNPPLLNKGNNSSTNDPSACLQGIKICIDPGHGGSEKGSLGCSGLPESQLNLEISSKLKSSLEQLGATVIMTRMSQNENPSLDERVRIATDAQTDFLISIHNNALPDGRDPWKEHGTSSYWYHPQSIELANCLKNSVKNASGFIDLGARYQNLALARGPAMPSVLLEIGFMINPDEFTCLIDPSFQSRIAQAIADGIKKYLTINKTTD